MSYYMGKDDTVRYYNESLILSEDMKYNEAKSILQPILNSSTLKNPADVYEVYGDLVYQSHGTTGDILVFYKRSLEYKDTSRVRKKISILSSSSGEVELQDITRDTLSDDISESFTGTTEALSRRKDLLDDMSGSQNIRDLSSGMFEPQDIITRSLDILSTGSSIPKDW